MFIAADGAGNGIVMLLKMHHDDKSPAFDVLRRSPLGFRHWTSFRNASLVIRHSAQMGRRSLRKPDPTLDVTRHLKTWEDLPRPWDSALLFGRTAPLEIEVGSGKGLFLSAAASAEPDRDFLGIEIAAKYAGYAAARLARQALRNAVVVHGDAQRLFRELLPDACLAAVHVYFPDPWWKARHKKRRVMNESFVRDIERTLAQSGRLHFWTDVKEYFLTTLNLVAAGTRFAGPHAVDERPAEHDLDYRTHFERRMRLHGEPVYRAEFTKPAASSL
jgi:tRNA (guanine-N7-)-methyltransferase